MSRMARRRIRRRSLLIPIFFIDSMDKYSKQEIKWNLEMLVRHPKWTRIWLKAIWFHLRHHAEIEKARDSFDNCYEDDYDYGVKQHRYDTHGDHPQYK